MKLQLPPNHGPPLTTPTILERRIIAHRLQTMLHWSYWWYLQQSGRRRWGSGLNATRLEASGNHNSSDGGRFSRGGNTWAEFWRICQPGEGVGRCSRQKEPSMQEQGRQESMHVWYTAVVSTWLEYWNVVRWDVANRSQRCIMARSP